MGKEQFFRPDLLRVVSYHNKTGAVLNNVTHFPGGVETLLPVPMRPQGIHFVKLECNLDFSTLKTSPNSRSMLPQFYLELPLSANVNNLVEGTDYPYDAQL